MCARILFGILVVVSCLSQRAVAQDGAAGFPAVSLDPVAALSAVSAQQPGWTRYLTAVAGRLPTVLYTHQRHALVMRFPSAWTLVEVQIGDPSIWTLAWRPNLVIVQPAVLASRTNLTMIFSDGRILQAALVEVSDTDSGRHGQVYVGPEPWLASQLVATLPERLREDADALELVDLLAQPETLVARLEGTSQFPVPRPVVSTVVPETAAAPPAATVDSEPALAPVSSPSVVPVVPAVSNEPVESTVGIVVPDDFPGTVTGVDPALPLPDVVPPDAPDFGDAFPPLPGPGASLVLPFGDEPDIARSLGVRLPGAAPLAAIVAGVLPDAANVDPLFLAHVIDREARPHLVVQDDPAPGDAQSFAPPPVVPPAGTAESGELVSGVEMESLDADVRALRDRLAASRRAAGERVANALLQSEQQLEQWRTRLPEQVQMSLVWDPPVPPWSPPLWHWGAWHDGRFTYIRMLAPDPVFYDVVSDRVVEAAITDMSLYAIDGVFDQLAVSVRDPDNRGSLVQVILRRRVELEHP